MPITSYDNIINFSKNCGAEIPSWILNRLKLYRSDAKSLKEFGEDVVSEMCLKLKAGGSEEFSFLQYEQSRTSPIYRKKNFVKKKLSGMYDDIQVYFYLVKK